jgi:predicted porin
LTDSADSRDLRSLSLSTFFEHQVTQSTHLALDAGLNRIDYEQSPSTDGAEIGAKIAKEAAWQALDWAASLRRRENQVSSNKVIIDDINLDLGYGWTRKLRTFGVVSHTEASVSNIDSDSFLLGLEYTPGKRTRLKIAVGERDHNESYALDIEYGQRHVKLTVGYDEKLQTPRQQTLQDLNNADAFHTTFRDLSISPSLQKRTDLGINIQGKRSDFRVTWFDSSREELGGLAGFRTRQQGVSLGVSRQIGSRAKVDLNLLHQETRQNEENRLDDVSLAWSKQLSRSIFTEIRLRQSEQESSNIQNNYLQRSITVSIRAEL